jgi:hypothetical protein
LSSFTSQRSNQSLPKSVPVLPENKKLKISPPFSKNAVFVIVSQQKSTPNRPALVFKKQAL